MDIKTFKVSNTWEMILIIFQQSHVILHYFICKILVGTIKLISDCIARMHYTIDYFLCLLLI